jgi:hypothetical protein
MGAGESAQTAELSVEFADPLQDQGKGASCNWEIELCRTCPVLAGVYTLRKL